MGVPYIRANRSELPCVPASMQHPSTLADLPVLWRTLAAQQRRLGADSQARTLEYCADELTATIIRADDELLSLRRAAQESGYSVDHLGRLLREGRIPNSGRKAKPLIRRRDLPRKVEKTRVRPCLSPASGYVPDGLFRDIIHSKFGGDDAQD
jgi:hypothetical protein